MKKLKKLNEQAIRKIEAMVYDSGDGYANWGPDIAYTDPEFIQIETFSVLLPIPKKNHSNIRVLKTLKDEKDGTLVLILENKAREDEDDPDGFLAICTRIPNEDFYVAVLYHQWVDMCQHYIQELKPPWGIMREKQD